MQNKFREELEELVFFDLWIPDFGFRFWIPVSGFRVLGLPQIFSLRTMELHVLGTVSHSLLKFSSYITGFHYCKIYHTKFSYCTNP